MSYESRASRSNKSGRLDTSHLVISERKNFMERSHACTQKYILYFKVLQPVSKVGIHFDSNMYCIKQFSFFPGILIVKLQKVLSVFIT